MNYQQIIGKIHQEVDLLNWKCCIDGCDSKSINSHFLQKNGILSLLTDDRHLIEVKMKSPFSWENNMTIFAFEKLGIEKVMSIKLFCKTHDNDIFKDIESKDCDFTTYRAFLLLSYRVTFGELRKKQKALEVYRRILEYRPLEEMIDIEFVMRMMMGFILGIEDLEKLIKIIDEQIQNPIEEVFKFNIYEYPRIDVYASAIFSPDDSESSNLDEDEDLENIYIHIIPRETKTLVLVGYHNLYANEWVRRYAKSWEGLSNYEFTAKLSELFACRIENWGLSEKLFQTIPFEKIEAYCKNSHKNVFNSVVDKSLQFNLFY